MRCTELLEETFPFDRIVSTAKPPTSLQYPATRPSNKTPWRTRHCCPEAQVRKIVGAYEAKTRLSELLEKVEAGEEITITKHGVAVAKLVPVRKGVRPEERAAAIDRIQKLGSSLSLAGLKVKDLIR